MLTGKINYHSESKEYPEKVISNVELKSGRVSEVPMETIPNVNRKTFDEVEYSNTKIDLTSKTTYPEEAKVKLDSAALLRRTDMEVARIIRGGLYSSSLEAISSYVASSNPEYIVVKENGVITLKKNDGSATTSPNTDLETPIKPQTLPEEINNNNAVEENRRQTEEEVKVADEEKITGTNYPIVANTAGQEYLALAFINHEETISLKAFPEYGDASELIDDIFFVWFQNPYIMTLNTSKMKYTYEPGIGVILSVSYGVDKTTTQRYQKEVYDKTKQVVSQIITPGMSESKKVEAIYNYLEKNAAYDMEAYNYMVSGATDIYERYPNSWNTYGILCEGKGVCQSYAYAFCVLAKEAGLNPIMVTGAMNNGGHAWNAVELNGRWYMVDPTNNGKSGMPYWICDSSSDFIYENGFTLDDYFVDGTQYTSYLNNDEKRDWYFENSLFAKTPEEVAEIWIREKNKSNGVIIKYKMENQNDFNERFVEKVLNRGISKDELMNLSYTAAAGLIMIGVN